MIKKLRKAWRVLFPRPVTKASIVSHPAPAEARRRRYTYSGQSLTWNRTLQALAAHYPVSQTMVALRTELDASTVPMILAQMKADGLVITERITVGSRALSYRLSDAGVAAAMTANVAIGSTDVEQHQK